jgi:DNA polymerase III epsilon subunit-like protein
MTTPTAAEILAMLRAATPRPTSEAPDDARGIYGLFDHTGAFRYIGSTSSASETFRKRIHQRHRTGSESTSHYFSRMYNTGRMWRQRNDPATKADGDIAKALRNAFIARHCAAVWVPLPDHADIAGLEAQVIALAPQDMIAWNRRGMDPYEEPTELVDALIEELDLSPFERAALGRQLARSREEASAPSSKLHDVAPAAAGVLPMLPHGPFRFFALDVETANHDRASICQVGIACVRPDGRIETWVTLVDPGTDRWVFSGLHGITRDMVIGAPTIAEVLDPLEARLVGCPVYQHSGFDRSAIRAACATLGRPEPGWNWQNSVTVARAAWPELKGNGGHGLASLKEYLGLKFEHHDAGEDARAAAEVVLRAAGGARGLVDVVDVVDDEDPGLSAHADTGLRSKLPSPPTGKTPAAEKPMRGLIGRSVLSQSNLNNHHFYLRDFISSFPEEALGGSNRASAAERTLTISWGGAFSVVTDIDLTKKIFRDRSWVRSFFAENDARAGDTVEITETAPFCYQVALVRA